MTFLYSEQGGHTRLIWNGCWSKKGLHFYTVGRDKLVVKWSLKDNQWSKGASITFKEAITAIDSEDNEEYERILIGTERLRFYSEVTYVYLYM